MDIYKFTEFMKTYGHDLVKYYTHIVDDYNQNIVREVLYLDFNNSDEYWLELSKKISISSYKNRKLSVESTMIPCGGDADNMYSTCWFGEEFFVWLFKDIYKRSFCSNSLKLPIILPKNSNIHGCYEYKESHSFFIMTTKDKVVIFNNLGGSCDFIVNTLSIEKAEELLNRLYNNDYDLNNTGEELFGYELYVSDYDLELDDSREDIDILFDIHELHTPTHHEMVDKIKWIIDNTVHDLDTKYLENLFDEYLNISNI